MPRFSFLKDLQFRLEYVALRAISGIFRTLPLDSATAFSAWSWRLLAPVINPKRHRRALENLKIAFPEKSDEECRTIALKHWENLGRVMVETMRIDKLIKEPERIHIVNGETFMRYRDKLGSCLLYTSPSPRDL